MDLPARLGKYELIEFLGGGMSHVYRAKDTVIGRTVAVKILTPEGVADQDVKDRFLLEARMAGNISHENVISIFDFGEIEGRPFLVMEFLQGDSLRTLIKEGRTGDSAQKLQIAVQAARALEYIHSQNIIHRDIKPDNIHVNAKGVVKLIDFGIAKMQDLTRTRAGFVLGTPYYMAPEQIRGEKLTPQVDVFAFGVLMFELFAGVKLFKASAVEEIFYQILSVPFDFTPLKVAGVSDELYALIARCLEKDPAKRPAGLHEVRKRLEEIAASVAAPAAPVDTARTNNVLMYAGAGVAALILVAAYLAWSTTRPKPLAPFLETPSGQMVLIPAGPFLSGADKQSVEAGDYYIDKTEVTRAAYAEYAKARNRALPAGFQADRLPMTDITIDDARDFAAWAGKRLPTMLEWEKAARGADGRIYPWGNTADAQSANLFRDGSRDGGLWPADQAARDISPFGILNMGGNASEFVDQLRTPSPDAVARFASLVTPPPRPDEAWYTFRGGSYRLPIEAAIVYEWGAIPARFHGPDLGFRCARDARPGTRTR